MTCFTIGSECLGGDERSLVMLCVMTIRTVEAAYKFFAIKRGTFS